MSRRLEPGALLHGTYRVIRQLGAGGMGAVYEAAHTRLAGRYAIKVLLPEVAARPEAFARFRREAEVTSALRDPAIVQVIDFNQLEDGTPYLVMEFVEGRELAQLIAAEAPFSLARTCHLVSALAGGLAAAHRCDVVHRDLKPANVLVIPPAAGRADERVKILDFGISKVRSASLQMTSDSLLLGTPQYMSPEQGYGANSAVDARTDQFALAAIAFEMLTRQRPFVAPSVAALVYKIVHEDSPPLARFRSDLPPAVDEVLRQGLAKRPRDRFATIDDFAAALVTAAFGAGDRPASGALARAGTVGLAGGSGAQRAPGVHTTLSNGAHEKVSGERRARPAWPALIAVTGFLGGAFAAGFLASREEPPVAEIAPEPVAPARASEPVAPARASEPVAPSSPFLAPDPALQADAGAAAVTAPATDPPAVVSEPAIAAPVDRPRRARRRAPLETDSLLPPPPAPARRKDTLVDEL